MAAILLFLLVSALSSASAQQAQSNITRGFSLSPTTNPSWLSPSGLFAFGFYPQRNGFIVGIWFARFSKKSLVWTANRDDPPVSSDIALLFTSDGRLVLRPTEGDEVTVIDAPQSAYSASMQDSGNFVLYDSDRKVIWQSFDYPTDTLLQGQRLIAGKNLFSGLSETDSSTGIFRLQMQNDGNLVQYPVQTPGIPVTAADAYWSSGTVGGGENVTLNLDDDGRLYLLNSTGLNIKNITTAQLPRPTSGTIYRLTLDEDGIFRLYSHGSDRNGDWSIIYRSSINRCAPIGLCGLNSFCTLNDQDPDCKCLPGFDFIAQSQHGLGCVRNFSKGGCSNKSEKGRYTIYVVENTIWENDPYFVLSSTTKEACKDECLKDCSCDVALFKDEECRKQRLPLRYGKRDLGESTMALVKVSSETPVSGKDGNYITRGNPTEKKKELRLVILIISISFATLTLIVLAISGVIVHRHRVWAYKKILLEQQNIGLAEDVVLRSFTYKELEEATNGFRDELGRGSFGIVFKGTLLNNQRLVAIKRLENVVAQGEREFRTEMKVIGRTQHKNLVRLLGYCHEGPNRLLVYEFMSNGTLADMLFKLETRPCWDERVGITLDVARGILYLHEECETQIIHCDIKPQNILMDDNRCAKISDFSLAKMLKPEETKTFTGIRGTLGYVAPEWHRRTSITVKADVYSFGIVLLEIICCRRKMDMNCAEDEVILVDWVYTCLQAGELQKLVGDEEVDKRKLERMVRVGIWCIQDEPSLRPSMKKAVLMLEGTVDIPVPPGPSSFLSSV